MTTRKALLVVLVASMAALAMGAGPRLVETARALPPASGQAPPGMAIPYTGRLADEAGGPVIDGVYDFTFALYEAETGGDPKWSELQEGVSVKQGAFAVSLGASAPLGFDLVAGHDYWLGVGVRGPADTGFTELSPRQLLSAAVPAVPASVQAGPTCAHAHWGERWEGYGLYGLALYNQYGAGTTVGFARDDLIAISAVSYGGTKTSPTLSLSNQNTTSGMAAYLSNDSSYDTVHIDNKGTGGVLFLQNDGNDIGTGGGDFITAVSRTNDKQFRVASNGNVYNDLGIYTGPADFAEMLPAVEGLQAGDVLAIGAEGKLTRSEEPYQTSVAGVYSTEPGFVGGYPVDGAVAGTIPLAIVGVAPVKVSAENGSIEPGDLLVTSSVAGHAMVAGPNPPQGSVLGKALEGWAADQGTGVITILVTLQ